MIGGQGAEDRFLIDAHRGASVAPSTIAVVERIVAERSADTRWWSAWGARMDDLSASGEAHEREIETVIAGLEAGWASDATFNARWDAMSYREALAFQRERGQ